jgi:Uma2 family endonuclease
MATKMRISAEAFETLALAEPGPKWELVDGHLGERPGMTASHNWLIDWLGFLLLSQLDRSAFQIRTNSARVRRPEATYLIPDLIVLPKALAVPLLNRDDLLEVYGDPLPLVVEIWSRSTGDYAVTEKLAVYQQRGDLDIWLIHPCERALTSRVRQADGAYRETVDREGIVCPAALPGIAIDLAVLFEGYARSGVPDDWKRSRLRASPGQPSCDNDRIETRRVRGGVVTA